MKTVRCPQCNLANWEIEINCKRCAALLETTSETGGATESAKASGSDSIYPGGAAHRAFQPNHKAAAKKTGMAIASMVIGIVGCFLAAPVGLILGIVALVRANKRPLEYGGKGFAIAGIALNVIGVLTLPIIAAIAVPNFLAGLRAANEASAVGTMRRIADAENEFREAMAGRCGDIKSLIAARLLDVDLANEEKNGYRFMIVNLPTEAGGCEIHAAPITLSDGTRSFYYSTEDGILRAAAKKGRPAGKDDEPLESNREAERKRPPSIAVKKTDSF